VSAPLDVLLMVAALSAAAGGTPSQGATDEATVRSLDDRERLAVLKSDTATLQRVWSDQIIVNNPQNGVTLARRDLLSLVEKRLIQYSAFERTVEAVRVDHDIAIIMGAEVVHPIVPAAGTSQNVRRRFTNVWRKEGGTWRLFARHANVVAAPPS
jgi:ketosteroid isomerase-like protein